MSALTSFAGARPIAQHCSELLVRPSKSVLHSSRLSEVVAEVAARLSQEFGRLLGGARVAVTVAVCQSSAAADFYDTGDALSVWAMLPVPDGGHLVLHTSGASLLALTERVFGGERADSGDLPETLPLTTELLAAQVHTLIAATLSDILGLSAALQVDQRSSANTATSAALAKGEPYHLLAFTLAQAGQPDCVFDVAVSDVAHAALFVDGVARSNKEGQENVPALLAAAGVQFDLRAILAELCLPLIDVARLSPGDTIPLALGRGAKLKAGDVAIAEGIIGAVDGSVALQLTKVF